MEIAQPCGGQGRCGRCLVRVATQPVGNGSGAAVRRRSTLRLSSQDIESGYALACQSVVEGDAVIAVPPQEKVERRLTTDLRPDSVTVPAGYDYRSCQTIQRFDLSLPPPTMDDQRDDWSRLGTALRKAAIESQVAGSERQVAGSKSQVASPSATISLPLLRRIGKVLRDADWQVSVVVDTAGAPTMRLIDLRPRLAGSEGSPLWGAAVDIGTTTVTVWLVDLLSGQVQRQAAEYNGQIARGEDVISRIIYASKSAEHAGEMRQLVLDTINGLLTRCCERSVKAELSDSQ